MIGARRPALVAVLIALALFFTRRADACTCADVFEPNQEKLDADALAESAAVFRGRALGPAAPSPLDSLLGLLPGQRDERRRFAFQVREVWKGDVPPRVVVTTGLGNGGCGTEFETGVEYVVFARGDDLYTSICSRNFAVGTRHVAWLGPSRLPAHSPSRSLLWLALAIVAALGLGAYLWRARARPPS